MVCMYTCVIRRFHDRKAELYRAYGVSPDLDDMTGVRLGPMETFEVKGRGCDYAITNVGAVPGAEAFLITSDGVSILYDSGYGFCGPALVENIREVLKGRSLDYILITHSHYDHILGSVHCSREWPDARVVASRHTHEVISKESARRTMRRLDASAADLHGCTDYEDLIDLLHVDVVVSEGDVIHAGPFDFVVHEYPGHTFCSIGFHCPEEGMLLSCETLGLYVEGDVMAPTYLVGYGMTLDSIRRAMALEPRVMLLPHAGVATGERCHVLLESSLRAAASWAEEIICAHRNGSDFDEILGILKSRHFTGCIRTIQPEVAFDLNAKYMIPMIIRKLGDDSSTE